MSCIYYIGKMSLYLKKCLLKLNTYIREVGTIEKLRNEETEKCGK
jgi:hypothetical protein